MQVDAQILSLGRAVADRDAQIERLQESLRWVGTALQNVGVDVAALVIVDQVRQLVDKAEREGAKRVHVSALRELLYIE